MCRESIVLAIRSARSSTGCCSITSTGSCQNMRDVSRSSTGFAVLRREANEGGYFRPIIQEVVGRYLDCGNPRSGFARIRCPDCHAEHLLTFSCKTRGFCPSCHAKRLEEWGEWVQETLLLDVPHRQVVFTIPKTLRIFFRFRRGLLGELCRSAVKTLTVYFEALTGEELVSGIIVAVQTFGDRINFHPHLHLLLTEGGVDRAGIFHRLPRLDDARLAEIFGREILAFLVSKGLLSPEWAERILSWRHTGFNVHSRVRARTKVEAERVGKYMVRPILALDRLLFLEREGKVGYRHGQNGAELETMDYLGFIARLTSHIPDKGQVMVRYYGLYANAHKHLRAGRTDGGRFGLYSWRRFYGAMSAAEESGGYE